MTSLKVLKVIQQDKIEKNLKCEAAELQPRLWTTTDICFPDVQFPLSKIDAQ